jgi:glycoprotease/Kae1 family metallohydrolase
MKVLGIESTAHTFGVGLTDGKRELLNKRVMYKTFGGIHPREASQFMSAEAPKLFEGLDLSKVDAIAYARGPGLGPCLRVGSSIAKTLSLVYKKPLVGVNHCIAHVEVGKWATGCRDPLVVYVSGANTQVLALQGGRYRIFGETLDVGMGNAIDMLGRDMKLEFPAGPKIEKLAAEWKGEMLALPYTVKGMDLTFSGITTAAKKLVGKASPEQLAFSFQETIFSMLVEVTERALAHTKKKEVLLVGGVAQNKRLAGMLTSMAKEHNADFFVPKPEYNGDNGFMIAVTGWKMARAKAFEGLVGVDQYWRPDDVAVSWH